MKSKVFFEIMERLANAVTPDDLREVERITDHAYQHDETITPAQNELIYKYINRFFSEVE